MAGLTGSLWADDRWDCSSSFGHWPISEFKTKTNDTTSPEYRILTVVFIFHNSTIRCAHLTCCACPRKTRNISTNEKPWEGHAYTSFHSTEAPFGHFQLAARSKHKNNLLLYLDSLNIFQDIANSLYLFHFARKRDRKKHLFCYGRNQLLIASKATGSRLNLDRRSKDDK